MASATWKGSARIGLAQFPVRMRGAVKEQKFGFNQHHDPAECKAGGGRARTGPSICDGCGSQLEKDQIVRGYAGVPGVDESYLESLEKEKSGVMEFDQLVPASQIDARMYAKSYDLIADKGGEKMYALMLVMLRDDDLVAIGKVVMGGKEQIVALRPREGVLAVELLYWPEEVDAAGTVSEARDAIAGIELSEKEIAMGKQLGAMLTGDVDWSQFRNEFAADMTAYLQAFVAGQAPAPIVERTSAASPMADLESMLAASLVAQEQKAA
jgi:DNA end-binding protein Ku